MDGMRNVSILIFLDALISAKNQWDLSVGGQESISMSWVVSPTKEIVLVTLVSNVTHKESRTPPT